MEAESNTQPGPALKASGKKFGTFEGVFLPNLLTILGVILYLRLGKIMGESGLVYGILIILLAHLVTITTALSLSAIATNMRMRAGGAYYVISRSLGVEWGGCIGIPLALSQTLSIALYTLGFAESVKMLSSLDSFAFLRHLGAYPMWMVGSAALAGMALLSLMGSGIVLRTQYLVLGLVVLSLGAILYATPLTTPNPHLFGKFSDLNFWQGFALFFPAATGITAGVSLSGDLKTPRVSIPRGTMASVFVGLAVYLVLAVFLCFSASPEQLTGDNFILFKVAWRPEPVIGGIWAATISSGLGMILAAPRTIQALANDGVLPRFLGRTVGKNREPMIAMIVALIIAEGAILLGNLDIVAPVLSMFFLVAYGMLNLISGLETLIGNPSYRPTIRTPWWISLLGAGCCFYVMFVIDVRATLLSIAFVAVTYLFLKHRHLKSTWGDLRRGFWLSIIRRSLLQVERLPDHPKNWRPHIVVITGVPQGRLNIVELADWFGSRRGLVTIRHVMTGPFRKMLARKRLAYNNLTKFVRDEGLTALTAVDVVEDRATDLRKILDSQGFGAFSANTVILDWDERSQLNRGEFEKLCEGILVADKTLLILHVDSDRRFGDRKNIHIWMDLKSPHHSMMLLLGYLISQGEDWPGSHIHVHIIGCNEADEQECSDAEASLRESRIPMDVTFHTDLEAADIHSQADEITRRSTDPDLLIVPFPYDGSDADQMLPVLDQLAAAVDRLPSVLIVRGQTAVDLRE